MAKFKTIEPTTQNILAMQNALNTIDCLGQGQKRKLVQ